jgi:3-hydroxyisobutyrate dehydrogenase
MCIGFIGLGTMGAPASLNLIRGGHDLVVHDLDADRARPHIEQGAQWADSARAVAEQAEVIFTIVYGPR